MRSLINSTRAELLRIRKWPAIWMMGGVWLILNLVFGYLFPYLSYVSGTKTFSVEGGSRAELISSILPASAPAVVVQGMPMFGGAIILTLGALVAGSGYSWGTWKTVMLQGPRRTAAFGGTILAVLSVVFLVVVATMVVDFGAASLIAAGQSQSLAWPAFSVILQGFGSGLLIMAMWALGGIALGTIARGPALGIGLGLVWALVLENLLRGVSSVLGPFEKAVDWMPGTASGSLASAINGAPSAQSGAPGVVSVLSGGSATLTLAVYALLFGGIAMVLMRRRDIA
ncbi:hypothetical protein CLV47_11635 [Antricoccus suffuscus]|uniref:ABC-type transport system involved in multi-copper enzyme maturation permease subunit n=1 Tax=Antricoccus suffuscus TaxID=1629062 RepID=A0A2T0ZVX6_9ACTN|nr:ABC transporter permease [Antricoccus suffuscus]PRZ40502.1 hypothetical protein CLV47_11635 [Antricoccus suffuscus]